MISLDYNKSSLFIFDIKNDDLNFELNKPTYVLIINDIPELVLKELILKGVKHFICGGNNAEALHDSVDDVIESCTKNSAILTTYHDDESIEEICDFFLDFTNLDNNLDATFFAILDFSSEYDLHYIDYLKEKSARSR